MNSTEIFEYFPWLKQYSIQQLEELQQKGSFVESAGRNLYLHEEDFNYNDTVGSNQLKTLQENYIDSVYDFLEYTSFNPAGPDLKREDAKSLLEYYAFSDERQRGKNDVRRNSEKIETNHRRGK